MGTVRSLVVRPGAPISLGARSPSGRSPINGAKVRPSWEDTVTRLKKGQLGLWRGWAAVAHPKGPAD